MEKLNFKIRPFTYGENSFPHTACWRGYQGIWSIENDSLFLLEVIKIDSTQQRINLKDYFKINGYEATILDGKIFADWYSSTLEPYFAYYAKDCLFESYKPKRRKTKLEFSNGILIFNKLRKK